MKFKLGELFSGPGGLALGAKLARVSNGAGEFSINHVWANDSHLDSCSTYRKNILNGSKGQIHTCSVKDLRIEGLPSIDAFAYGFPCNDFSIVGEHKGMNGHYGGLYEYGVDVINANNPLWLLAENVGGITNANDGKAFEVILRQLETAGSYGYDLVVHKYRFEEYGVPQTRHRVIIVGTRKDLDLDFRVPAPTTPSLSQQITAKEAFTSPPIDKNASNNELTNHPQKVIERLKAIPPGENAWWDGLPDDLRLNVKGAKLSQIYRRLSPDQPAYTITGSGGGGTHGYHWKEPRALTNRERARLQTFPDWFEFAGGKESVRRQIGMAVPPKAAKQVFEAILKTFASVDYEFVKPNFIMS